MEQSLKKRLDAFVGRGAEFVTVARDRVTIEGIRQAVDTVGDRNPIHADEAFARGTEHGGLVAPPASVLWWHRGHFEPVESSDTVDADGVRHFRLDPNPIRQQGMKTNELGLLAEVLKVLADAGYSSLAVTNSQTFIARYPRIGDLLSCRGPRIDAVTGPKKTSLGEGFFTTSTYELVDESGGEVARWETTRLHFKPA